MIGLGKTKEVLGLLIKASTGRTRLHNDLLLLKGRYDDNERSNYLNTISNENYSMEKSRVVQALLNLIDENGITADVNVVPSTALRAQGSDALVTALIEAAEEVYIRTKRFEDQSVPSRALGVIEKIQAYKKQKRDVAGYDVSGRQLDLLEQDVADLRGMVAENVADTLEDFMMKVNGLIREPQPSWENLDSAYKLCTGRGMKDEWVEQQMSLRSDVGRVRADIATKIELFLHSLKPSL